jgi:hypothetical protein
MTRNLLEGNWRDRRVAFNHDWLKNIYLNRLRECEVRLAMPDPDWQRVERFFQEDFPQWREHRLEALTLADSCATELSPCILFTMPPLSRLADLTKEWLPDIIHAFWMQRHGVEAKMATVWESAARTQALYESLRVLIHELGTSGSGKHSELLAKLRAYADACAELSQALSALPKETPLK